MSIGKPDMLPFAVCGGGCVYLWWQVCDYKDGRYPHYFEVHSPMGNMRLRADDAAGKEAWVTSLQKQAKVTGAVEIEKIIRNLGLEYVLAKYRRAEGSV